MGDRRSDWVKAKKELDRAGVDTHSVFREALGPALDAYDAAETATEKAVANSRGNPRTDPTVTAAKSRLTKAYNAAAPIGGQYLNDLVFLEEWARNATAKKAVEAAQGTLVRILDGMKRSYGRLSM